MGWDVLETVLACGGGAFIGTVLANKTDVAWLKGQVKRLDAAIVRAHRRIDSLMEKS